VSEHFPNIRLRTPGGVILVRDGLSLRFYMRHPHREIAGRVMRTLARYLDVTGPLLGKFTDDEGEWHDLDGAAWARIRDQLQHGTVFQMKLADVSSKEERFKFEYMARELDPAAQMRYWPGEVCAMELWLPTEMLLERGPDHVRQLTLELADPLPFCSGQAGLALNGPLDVVGVPHDLRRLCARYPGIEIVAIGHDADYVGTKVQTPSWLTFLGQPVLGEIGGVEGLRSRLRWPETTVQAMEGDRAVVTLGPWPEAGDAEKGILLPAYRELAHALEPWRLVYPEEDRGLFRSAEERLRWDRRFLD